MSDPHLPISLTTPDALICLDRINSIIAQNLQLDAMLPQILDEMLTIFQCDRAWFMYPCDPDSDHIVVEYERTRSECTPLSAAGAAHPLTDATRDFLKRCLDGSKPIRFDPDHDPVESLPGDDMDHFDIKSQMSLFLMPNKGPNWILGIQHCNAPVVYDQAAALFHAIGKRIAVGISSAMAMQELLTSEQRYRALVDHATEAILIVDCDNLLYDDANPRAHSLFGVAAGELISLRTLGDFSPTYQPDGAISRKLLHSYLEQALAGDLPKFEWVGLTASGQEIICEVSLVIFPDPKRRLVRASVVDIGDRKAAEAQREDLDRRLTHAQRLEAVGHLTGGVAHDFNNLLSVIMGNLELLLMEGEHGESSVELVRNCLAATHKGAELTRNMLSFARRAQLSPMALNLNDKIRETSEWTGRTIPATVAVRLLLAPTLWPVLADPTSTESAILNLVINACNAMSDAGILTIETSNLTVTAGDDTQAAIELAPGRYVLMTISDTGQGISPDLISQVFEPFYTTKPPGKGSGLGLSMVHGFMKQSGGSIHIESWVGVGTRVKMYFPALAAGSAQIPVAPAVPVPDKARPLRILVAEDQPDVLNVIVRILQGAGHDVFGVPSGDQALRLFQTSGPFDILVTDIVMPGVLQGPGLARTLRLLNPDLPVIFMTGYAREAAMYGNGLRSDDIRLMKPVSRAQLLGAVLQAAGSHSAPD